jgi:hypothetical protein
LVLVLMVTMGLPGCGGSNTAPVTDPVPATITMAPTSAVSLEIGKTQTFSATTNSSANTAVTTPITFVSSNTAVVTVAASGLACAGTWDSLSNPQLCTPGAVGSADITATAQGVSSAPTTVYVHQHIDHVAITPVTTPNVACVSKTGTFIYQAQAFSNTGVDITQTVGSFVWQAANANVASLSTTATTLPAPQTLARQAQVTANAPGTTQLFVTIGGTSSLPLQFTTCAVQSISLQADGVLATSLPFSTTGSKTLTPIVIDTSGTTITGVNLTWISSNPASATVASGVVSATNQGGATVIAACLPPLCNIGFQPSLPIYSTNPVAVTVSGSTTGTAQSNTVYVATTDCGVIDDCVGHIVPITTPANTVGNGINLTATPSNMVINRQGNKIFLGTEKGLLGSKGLMVIDLTASPVTLTNQNAVPGKVLAVSPDGNRVIVSDTSDTPNELFIFNSTDSSNIALPIAGATGADFSADSLKAFIAAGSTLYIYSTQDALQAIPLAAPATDAAALTSGIGAYLNGGSAAGFSFMPTCDVATSAGPAVTPIPLTGVKLMQPLPDGVSVITVQSPNVQTVTTTIPALLAPSTVLGQDGCPVPRGFVALSSAPGTAVDLGQGTFVPTQLLVSADGERAYIVASNLGNILVYDIRNHTTSSITLANNALPIRAALTTAGDKLYVTASDASVHVLDTATGADTAQVTFPQGLCSSASGTATYTCNPTLIAVKP